MMLPSVALWLLSLITFSLGTPLRHHFRHASWGARKFIMKRSPSLHGFSKQTALAAQAATLQKFQNAPALLAGQGTSRGYTIPSSLQKAYDRASDYATNIPLLKSLSMSSATPPLSSSWLRLAATANGTILDPLDDETDGVNDYEYYGELTFGSQAQSLSMDFDTGSADCWVPVDCNNCQGLQQFQASASSSFHNLSRVFAVRYGLGEVLGTVVQDTVSVGDFRVPNQTFGAVGSVSTNFANAPNDGLVGLAFGTIANTAAPTFFENLMVQMEAPLFSIYMTRKQHHGGEICFGCVDVSKAIEQAVIWLPVVSKTYWTVAMASISVNGASIPTNNLYTLVDTGTSFIYMPQETVAALYAQIPGSAPAPDYGQGFYKYRCAAQTAVSFVLGGHPLAMDPRDMNLGQYAGDPTNTTCIGAIVGSAFRFAILGDSFCKKYVTIFDYSHGARLGLLNSINE